VRPLVPALAIYTPSFDPGALDFSPKAISPELPPTSPSRARVSFDKTELQRGFHLPRRVSIDSPSDDDAPPRPSLELSPEYAFAKLEAQSPPLPPPPHGPAPLYPPGGASVHALRWLPRYAGVAEEDEDEDDLATTADSHMFSRERHRSASPLRSRAEGKFPGALKVPTPSAAGLEAPLSPSTASAHTSFLLSACLLTLRVPLQA
jgi:hypothetical protein